jgi:hypothetical protein
MFAQSNKHVECASIIVTYIIEEILLEIFEKEVLIKK